jgi:WD40 repeat protein
MSIQMSMIFDYVDKTFTTKSTKSKMMLKQRDFMVHRNVGNYIQEVLGSLILYQALYDYPEDKKKKLNEILERMGNQEDKRREQREEKEQLVNYISARLLEHDENLKIFPKWENKTDNYANLMSFKENFIDHIGVVRADYKFLKHYNMSVLKLCMNHIQMIVHQTKLKFVAENKVEKKSLDFERVSRLKRFKPEGILLTSINSHEAEVKCLAIINDNTFVSGSQDGHVKYHSLPALSRNFIHSSVLDIDLNRGNPNPEEKVKVNQLHYLKNINKLAVVTNQKEILICDEGKSAISTRLDSRARVTAATIYDMDDFRSCIATVNTECDFLLWDLRKKEPAMQCNLSKIRGVPSSICRINNESTNMIATYKGYLISHDIRTNMALSTYRLIYESKQIPITSVSQFIPHTRFKNLTDEFGNLTRENEDMLVTLTYPSKCNQFSIFNAYPISQLARNPKFHFESSRVETETTRPTELPILEDVTQKEKILDINAFSNERFEYFKEIVMNERSQFCLGESFKIRSVDSIVALYTDIFHKPKLSIKEECLSNLTSVMQTLSAMGDCNMTINKILSIPDSKVSKDIAIDNIILAAGTDKNIRYLNVGNEFDNFNPMQEDYGTLNGYHLSNMDNQYRSFKYCYSHDTCLFKETVLSSNATHQSNATESMSEISPGNSGSKFGLSFYHNNFLSNRKTSDTLPGHSASIRDMIVMEHEEALLVVSCGDDGAIKVWL